LIAIEDRCRRRKRGQQPNAGNGPTGFGSDTQGNAPGDYRSGTWVRVGGPTAGAN
jgi:hypothetical protein